MEIFIQNIPFTSGRESELKKALEPHLKALGIRAFRATVFNRRGNELRRNGTLTVPTIEVGQKFLERYGRWGPQGSIKIQGQILKFQISNKGCDKFVVKSLQKEQEELIRQSLKPQVQTTKLTRKRFCIEKIECGVWSTEAEGNAPIFDRYYSLSVEGHMRFGGKAVHVEFEGNDSPEVDYLSHVLESLGLGADNSSKRWIVVRYPEMISIVVSEQDPGSISFTLDMAPRFYQETKNNYGKEERKEERKRVTRLDQNHALYAPFALVYRVYFKNAADVDSVTLLGDHRGVPPIIRKRTTVRSAAIQFEQSSETLAGELRTKYSDPGKFPVAFQLQGMWANGYLPPSTVLRLLRPVNDFTQRYGCVQTANILRELLEGLMREDPTQEPGTLTYRALLSKLNEIAAYNSSRSLAGSLMALRVQKAQLKHMAFVHHASITPAGCYFYGPISEPQNRVLRKYPNHHEYFLRVTFCEEDGEQLMYEYNVDQKPIYSEQFLFYLTNGIVIASRKYEFLGFSSSSLRTQSCWFMAPFNLNGEYLDAKTVTSKLGDFSKITCPGRYAARVGQAFSDTYGSIDVPLEDELEISEVERNGRTFSDGVGTISQKMLNRVWKESESLSKTRPTVFQIRFAGAKGVVSLDTRLHGDKFCLRPSMIKFRGSEDRKIEICSSAAWLPMYLNRPLIKVLEDTGVAESTFMTLQNDAIKDLRKSTTSAAHAASFLKQQRIASTAIRLPFVIEALSNIGLNFRDDHFLEQAFELSLITSLRNLKHRARIPVAKGMTLVGVMDETGYLNEGEIYVTVQAPGGEVSESISGRVLITRSPVHHPGDVQMAFAIGTNQLPDDSPLRALRNCVAFSQQGKRDMPSMLSGGDLDGDLYNIIYDTRFTLKNTYSPAEYPRVPPKDLGRPVETGDITKFFLDFMANNLLGMISTRHLIIADQMAEGVHHPDCLRLAQLASTAVDFPKTGKKVDRRDFPKLSASKPDFMAPGPRILVAKEPALAQENAAQDDDDDEGTQVMYYESDKVLGKLYRTIDETAFLREVQGTVHRERRTRNVNEGAVIRGVWKYLEREIPAEYHWESYTDEAQELKDAYEKNVDQLMGNYSDMPWKHQLREVEVFIGCIVGKERQTQKQRDNSARMKDEFDRLATSIVESMRGGSRAETLGLGMASLSLCLPEKTWMNLDCLKSFVWVTISVLLTEVDRIQKEKRERPARRAR